VKRQFVRFGSAEVVAPADAFSGRAQAPARDFRPEPVPLHE